MPEEHQGYMRPTLAERRWSDYTVESLLAHTQRSEQIRVVTTI